MIARDPIATPRLRLEPISAQHDSDLVDAVHASRDELLPWMPWAVDPTPAGHRSMREASVAAWENGSEYHFAIVVDGRAGGVIGLNRVGDGEMEIHYWLRTSLVGRGYVTEAARALIDWAVDTLHVRRFRLDAGVDNARSLAVARRLGFARTGPVAGGMEGGLGPFAAHRHRYVITTPSRSGGSG